MKKFAALSALGLSLALILPAQANTPVPEPGTVQTLREAVRADRKAVVLKALALDEAQTAKFGKIYDGYEKELTALTRKFNRVVVEHVGLGDKLNAQQAKYFAREQMAFVDAENKLYRKYHPRVVRAIGEVGAAKFLAAEQRLRALQDYDLWL